MTEPTTDNMLTLDPILATFDVISGTTEAYCCDHNKIVCIQHTKYLHGVHHPQGFGNADLHKNMEVGIVGGST